MNRLASLVLVAGCDGVLHFEKVSGVDASGSADAFVEPGLVAYYPFDDVSGAACALDVAGGHGAQCSSTSSAVAGPKQHGTAIYFDGATYASTQHAVELDPTSEFTAALWVQPGEYFDANYWCMLNRPYGTADADSWQMCVGGGGSFFLFGDMYMTTPTIAPSLVWTHVAMTWDGSTTTIYFGGAVDATMPGTQPAYDPQGLWLGADNDNTLPGAFYTGAVDEVRIYNRALSGAEIATLAQ